MAITANELSRPGAAVVNNIVRSFALGSNKKLRSLRWPAGCVCVCMYDSQSVRAVPYRPMQRAADVALEGARLSPHAPQP